MLTLSKYEKLYLIFGLSLLLPLVSRGQSFLFFESNNYRPIQIPFDLEGGLMITDVRMNGYPLRFIFDTGAQQNLLLKKELDFFIDITYKRKVDIRGSDLSKKISAHLAQVQEFQIAKDVSAPTSLIVLEHDVFHIESLIGTQVDGIMGSNVFSNSVLFVDNKRNIVELIPYEKFKPTSFKNYFYFPIEVEGRRPYMYCWVTIGHNEPQLLKFLIDCGSSVPLLVYADKANNVHLPEHTIIGHLGTGLGGELKGFIGKVENIEFGEYEFNSFPASFQVIEDSISNEKSNNLLNRDGIIGNGILNRFNYIIDFHNAIIYMKPLRNYKKNFFYDKSGLILIAGGPKFEYVIIQSVLPSSPAAEAGLQPGDQILKFQGWNPEFSSVSDIQRKLGGKTGKKIKLKIQRSGRILHTTLVLRELL